MDNSNGSGRQLGRLEFMLLIGGLLGSSIGQSLIFAILPPLGRAVAFSEIQTNAIISLSALVFTVSSPWWGRLSDQVGRKPIVISGLVGYALGTVLFTSVFAMGLAGWITGGVLYVMALTTRCMQSLIMSGTNPAAAAYAADHSSPDRRTQTLARLGTATSMGMIIGPVFGAMLAGFGLLVPLFAAAALTGAAAVATWYLLPASEGPLRDRQLRHRLRLLDPRIRVYLLASFGGFVGFSMIQQTLGFRLQDSLTLTGTETAQYTGIALMTSAGFTFVIQLLVAQRFKGTPVLLMRWGLAAMFTGGMAIAASDSFAGLLVGMGFVGAGLGLLVPAVAAGASLAVSQEEQGGAAGLVTATPAAGFVVGPVAGGALYTINPTLAPLGAAIIVAAVLGLLLLTPRRQNS